ncbi:hypothetical protein [Aureibacter tunicatorum]|uniref:Uncharacterized protein n=1 Tax=Aureibacter tunicatorum TaxID=866807 RepID=A0AAE3XL60_9BACT|nr:hypothetical protein [Aureibacter tunicatorum]MDR6238462.1 hypothetical protein [Aureibacter tunicatorum]
MQKWLETHPEIKHIWGERFLKISHPVQQCKFIHFDIKRTSIEIEFEGQILKIHRKWFKSPKQQASEIRGFWVKKFIPENILEMQQPKIKTGQFVLMLTNHRFGQVLTINKNIYTGWGEVYKVFNNLNDCKKYVSEKQKAEIDYHIFDSNYELVKK